MLDLIRMYFRQSVMLAINDEQFIDLDGPVGIERGLGQQFVRSFFIFSIHRDPDPLRFHADGIMIHHAFLDQKIYIRAMRRNSLHEFLTHFKLYDGLI